MTLTNVHENLIARYREAHRRVWDAPGVYDPPMMTVGLAVAIWGYWGAIMKTTERHAVVVDYKKLPAKQASRIIIKDVAMAHDVFPSDILGLSHDPKIVAARHAAMRVVRAELGLSFPRIGRIFHRDHSTVVYACQKPIVTKVRTRKVCSVEGCDRMARTKGMCVMHYTRWFRHGSTDYPGHP